ncbi:MAG: acetyl-CoA carboxylase biotin carboxyl carrier protein subunit [Planctomycetes bacterium]|nr:acetyl-CoA carboxylase biotin carboxyl carrier protein subunit [Planctomycetota bacterium]MCB9885568.1 acetyl-CoA carboxylase biotin carboxyl carrier protein subunit [Planctomycetota bacterium]
MKYFAELDGEQREFVVERRAGKLWVTTGDRTFELDLSLVGDGATFSLLVDGHSYDVVADVERDQVTLQMVGERFAVRVEDERERAAHAVAGNKVGGKRELRAAMPGIVVDLKVGEGDAVEEGQTLVVLEAMKMQNPLLAEGPGKVVRLCCKKGEAVAAGALLLEIE